MPPSRIPSSAGLPLNPMTANYGSAKVGGTASPTTNGDARSRRPGVTLRAGTTAAAAVAAGAGGLNKTAGSAGVGGVEIEDFGPPEWRPVLNARADLGYPDFYPSRPGYGQSEDVLTEENVKNGYQAKAFVNLSTESFSMHGPVFKQFREGGLKLLNAFGEEIMQKREESMPPIGERSFRIPVRVTYNDTKRVQFLLDLANPDIPLSRLMKNPVPHGFKGTELFDTLYSPAASPTGVISNRSAGGPRLAADSIPIDRALWFIRVLGANEITAHRGRTSSSTTAVNPVSAPSPAAAATPSSTNTAQPTPSVPLSSNDWYSIEFTNLYTSWLRNQLAQLVLPVPNKGHQQQSKPQLASLPSKPVAGVLGDEAGRTRWLAKWSYSMVLLERLFGLRLISSRVLLGWLSDFLASANLAQLGLVAKLIGDYLPSVARHATIGRTCLRVACDRISEIRDSPAAASLRDADALLCSIVGALSRSNPEVLLSPATWTKHMVLIAEIIGMAPPTTDQAVPQNSNADRTPLGRAWRDMDRRNTALTFMPTAGESSSSPRRHQMEELHKLDSISAESNMSEVCRSFFDGNSSPLSANLDMAKFEEKVFLILNWAMGLYHLGAHRPYAAYTLLKLWQEARDEYLAKLGKAVVVDIFPQLYKWLDESTAARKPSNNHPIGIAFGEFTRRGLFSFSRYLQALISHGHTARARTDGPPSHHLALLKAMPIFVEARDLLHQRMITICGDDLQLRRRLEEEDEQALQAFMEEVKEYLPEVFGMKRYGRSPELRDAVDHPLPWTSGTSRHTFLQARFGFFPAVVDSIRPRDGSPPMSASTFARVMHLMRASLGFATLGDLVIRAIRDTSDEEIMRMVIDTLRRDAVHWTSQDRWPAITYALMERYQEGENKGRYDRELCDLLLELAEAGRLPAEDAADVREHVEAHKAQVTAKGRHPRDPKDHLPRLDRVVQAGDVFRSASLASKLFGDRDSFSPVDDAWFAHLLELFREASAANTKTIEAAFAHVDRACDLTGQNLDAVFTRWSEQHPSAAKMVLLAHRGSQIDRFLLKLVVWRRLSTQTLLGSLVYPTISHVATAALSHKLRISTADQLAAGRATALLQQLMLNAPLVPSLPPSTLQEAFVAQTYRATVLDNAHVPNLIKHLPLLILIRECRGTNSALGEDITRFLAALAMTPEFKTAAFRHLDLLKDAFLSSPWSKSGLNPEIEAGMVDTLKQIMSEGGPRSTKPGMSQLQLGSGARLSAWRWTSIVLEMRVEFKRLATRIENNEEPVEARESLRKLIQQSLHADMSADEADLLCETFRGVEALAMQEILAVGIDRLGSLLSSVIDAEDQAQTAGTRQTIDLLLRILSSSSRSACSDHAALQSVLAARHRMLDLIAVALQSVERQVSTGDDEATEPQLAPSPDAADSLSVIIKLLKFILALPVAEPPSAITPRPDMARLAVCFLRAAVHFVDTPALSASHVGDLLTYILDSGAAVSRATILSAVQAEASTSTTQSVLDAAPHLSAALPYTSSSAPMMALIGPTVSDSGDFDSTVTFDDRPWEMFEKMGPTARPPSHGYLFLASKPLPDMASVPATLFGPRLKRDALPDDPAGLEEQADDTSHDDTDDYTCFSSERNLGDGLAGEPIGARSWATGLFDDTDEATAYELARIVSVSLSDVKTAERPVAALPAEKARPRRMSGRIASGAGSQPSGGATDPITIDLDDDNDDDDGNDDDDRSDASSSSDEETLGGRATKRRRTASKTTASATRPVAAGKRPATGGKAPAAARATTGGKNVSRKATGGKRRPAGKAPVKGGKRKPSNA